MLPLRDQLPTRRVPFVNYALIGANVAAFAWEATVTSDLSVEGRALVPGLLAQHPATYASTLLTHMFLHGGVAHLAGNMLFLWIFGDNVEDALGHARYAAFYLLCGLGAAFSQIAMGPSSLVPMLGASGAIAGVLAAYGLLYPRSPILVINPIPLLWLFWGLFLYFPAWLVIIEFFAVNLWSALKTTADGGGVAFAAHVGGFITGGVLLFLLRPAPVAHDRWEQWARRRQPGRLW